MSFLFSRSKNYSLYGFKTLKVVISELAGLCNENTQEKIKSLIIGSQKLSRDVDLRKKSLLEFKLSNSVQQALSDENSESVNLSSDSKQPLSQKVAINLNKPERPRKKVDPNKPLDIGRLDIRVGKIISIQEIVTAENLYVEEVDVGESVTRTVVSGLMKFIPIEDLESRRVIVLCNMKSRSIRGYESEGMLLCACTDDKVEVLEPPPGSLPGDPVVVEGFAHDPDYTLNPKQKVFEAVLKDLKVNSNKVATYKDKPLVVVGKGNVTTESLTNVCIR